MSFADKFPRLQVANLEDGPEDVPANLTISRNSLSHNPCSITDDNIFVNLEIKF